MKRRLILLISLFCCVYADAQTKTDMTVENIAGYLNGHCAWGYVTDAVCGRNHSLYGSYGIDNSQMRATGTVIDSLQPLLGQLPHKRRMTDEQADEIFKGRIAMRLHPEQGDTSAYFLMDYNRTDISFKYGVNSPQSINILSEHSRSQHPNFEYHDIPADSVAPIINKFKEMQQRSDAIVKDTVFQYMENESANFDWWMGSKGEASRTPARIVLINNAEENDLAAWQKAVTTLKGSSNATIYATTSHTQGHPEMRSSSASFQTDSTFCLYHGVLYRQYLCLVRVIVPTWRQCALVPSTLDIIKRQQGQTARRPGLPVPTAAFEEHIDSLMAELLQGEEVQQKDTFFVSNDQEGHSWWDGLNDRCPTRATIVLTRCPAEFHSALRERLLKYCEGNTKTFEWNDEESQYLTLSWRDKSWRLHGLVVYYYPDGWLGVVRADGEEPRQICIPHFSLEWFGKK